MCLSRSRRFTCTTYCAPATVAAAVKRRRPRAQGGGGKRQGRVVGARPQHDDLAVGVVEQPGDVGGVEAGASVLGSCDHDAVEALLGDRLTEGVSTVSTASDARVDRDARLSGSLLDRLEE
jgi:hypothetical protein